MRYCQALRYQLQMSWPCNLGIDSEYRKNNATFPILALLAQTGVQTLPVVAGDHILDEAAELCRAMRMWQMLDGRVSAPSAP